MIFIKSSKNELAKNATRDFSEIYKEENLVTEGYGELLVGGIKVDNGEEPVGNVKVDNGEEPVGAVKVDNGEEPVGTVKVDNGETPEGDAENETIQGDEKIQLMAGIDIGTTCVAMEVYLCHIPKKYRQVFEEKEVKSGMCVALASEKNRQTIMGADVMMRLMHCINGKQDRLHAMICAQISEMLNDCIDEIKEKFGDYEYNLQAVSVVGNTTMCHLFLDRDVSNLAHAPFKPDYEGSVRTRGKFIGLTEFPETLIFVLPGVYAHVGSDALSSMCDCELYNEEGTCVLVDIGTNAEVFLKKGDKIYATSVAAGPAFEGSSTAFGMRAGAGACNMVRFAPMNDAIFIDMIEGEDLKGICAAGYIDIVSQLVRYGIITPDGYMVSSAEAEDSAYPFLADRLYDYRGKTAFLLCGQTGAESKNTTGIKNDSCVKNGMVYNGTSRKVKNIFVTQDDVREIQLAKAAICAGIKILLDKVDEKPENVDKLCVAGMLGNSISADECKEIGLFPNIKNEAFKMVGNAALEGASRALFDKGFREIAESMAQKIEHVELADDEKFDDVYMDCFEFSVK